MYTFIHRTIAPVGKCAWQLHYTSLGTVCPYFLCTFLPCSFIVFNIVTYTTHDEATVDNIEELLVMIDNPALRQLLMDTDKLTLKMLFLKMQGYSVDDIAMELGKQTDAVYKRLSRIKKKIKFTLA